MQFFDSHAHLSSPDVLPLIEDVLLRAQALNVSRIVNICTDPSTLTGGLLLAEKFPGIRNAGATTPHDVEKEGESAFSIFAEAARSGKLVAVGETGLEYFHPGLDREVQKDFLKKYLALGLECNLPVIFHCREAFQDLFAIADRQYRDKAPAILHCFTGTLGEARGVLDRGWYISISGIATFKKSEALRDVVKMIPLQQLLIETDTPYLAPQGHRGKANEPSFLPETAQCIAQIKGISLEEVAEITFNNAMRVFRIN